MNAVKILRWMSVLGFLPAAWGIQSATTEQMENALPASLVQFTAGGHVLGFAPDGIYAATGSHALHVEFVDARSVQPQSEGSSAEGRAAALERVTYTGLWDGIDLAFDAEAGGIYATTYTLAPGADPDDIRLLYNTPIIVKEDGTLDIAFETGMMTESAPVAWQEIGGERIPVEAGFRTAGNEVSFALGRYDPEYPLTVDPILAWNTFLGGDGQDAGQAIAVDGSGNSYVVGYSSETWGTPLHAFTDGWDLLVAKLDNSGGLVWHTFYGGSGTDWGYSIALDSSGNILVTGDSTATWGTPVRAFTTSFGDGFAAKFNSGGSLIWNTFLGGSGDDAGNDIAVDAVGNAYIAGASTATWGTPVRAYTNNNDAFVAKLNTSGSLTWHTFLGGSGDDAGYGVAVDGSGVYATGLTYASWGSPVRAYSSSGDAFAAKVNVTNGSLTWNTFLGGSGYDCGIDLLVYSTNLYLTGTSLASWGSPVRAYTSDYDAYVVRLVSSTGALTWNTFMGGAGEDKGYDITRDGSGYIILAGTSDASWGDPLLAYTGNFDAYAAKITSSGGLVSNLFLGYAGGDTGAGVSVRGFDVYISGVSTGTWGVPVRAYSSGTDLFVAKVNLTLPGAFNKLSPADEAYTTTGPTLTWEVSSGAVSYEYCIDTADNDLCDASWISTGTDQSAALSGLTAHTTYYWQVRAVNGAGYTEADGGTWWSITALPVSFADVPASHWAWSWIERLFAAGITSGCGGGNYCPNDPVTRAEMAIFLERGIHGSSYTPPAATGTVFGDVPISHWAAAWIEQLSADGITSGCGGGNYCPNDPVTRAEMAIFLLRSKHGSSYTPPAASGTVFGDVPISHWAAAWIEQLAAEGITSGCGGGNYCPNSPVTRAEMAVFLVRTFELP